MATDSPHHKKYDTKTTVYESPNGSLLYIVRPPLPSQPMFAVAWPIGRREKLCILPSDEWANASDEEILRDVSREVAIAMMLDDQSRASDSERQGGLITSDIFPIGNGRYYSAFAVVGRGVVDRAEDDMDWLGALWRDPGGPWTVTYRFRRGHQKEANELVSQRADLDDVSALELLGALAAQAVAFLSGKDTLIPVQSDDPEAIMRALKPFLYAPEGHGKGGMVQ